MVDLEARGQEDSGAWCRREKGGFWIAFCAVFFYPIGWLVGRSRFEGQEHIPPTGGALVVANHVSHLDPIFSGLVVHKAAAGAAVPRQAQPVAHAGARLGRCAGSGQIPVYRETADAQQSLRDGARARCRTGKVVVIYPEGTITRDPDGWPMQARTGVARLALSAGRAGGARSCTGAPARCSTATTSKFRPLPRKPITVRCGEPGRPVRLPRPPGRRRAAARGHRPADDAGCATCSPRCAASRPPTEFYRPERPRDGDVRRVAVLGAGSWGTAFAKVLADAGREVRLWARRPEVAAAINERHTNPDYLPGIVAADAADRHRRRRRRRSTGADAVVLAVPSQTLRANLAGWRDLLPPGAHAGEPGQGRRAGHAASG